MNSALLLYLLTIITVSAALYANSPVRARSPSLSKRNNFNFQFNVDGRRDASQGRDYPHGQRGPGADVGAGGAGQAPPARSTTTTTSTSVFWVEETHYVEDPEAFAAAVMAGLRDVPAAPTGVVAEGDVLEDTLVSDDTVAPPDLEGAAGEEGDEEEAADEMGEVDTVDGEGLMDTVDTVDTPDVPGTTDRADIADTADTVDSADTIGRDDNIETPPIADTIDAAEGSSDLEEEEEDIVDATDQTPDPPSSPAQDTSARVRPDPPILRPSQRNKALERPKISDTKPATKPYTEEEMDSHYKKLHTSRVKLQDSMCTMCFYLVPTAAGPMRDDENRVTRILGNRNEWVKYRDIKISLGQLLETFYEEEGAIPPEHAEDVCSTIISQEVFARTKKYEYNVISAAKDVKKATRAQKSRAQAYTDYIKDMQAGNIKFDCKGDYTQSVADLRRLLG